jgi:hypothetical protein
MADILSSELTMQPVVASASAQASFAVTPSGSPFVYVAAARGAIFVSAGTVSLVEYGRAGVFLVVGALTGGMFEMDAQDALRLTYIGAPTITFLPR